MPSVRRREDRHKTNSTGDGRLQLNHRLLGPEQRRSLIDDLQGSVLVQSSLQDEMLLQNLRLGLAGSGVKYLRHGELVGGGEGDAWKRVLPLFKVCILKNQICANFLEEKNENPC